MPAFVGAVQVINIGSSGVFHIGDVVQIHPISNTKTFSGAGSFNTGDRIKVYSQQSSTNTFDQDGWDQGTLLTM
ncbi:spore germination protein PA [Oikeobacillus pervagus]|uniref:Spore germination protein PA n=1 Tax=Oikeobacillus pervagus TaxID=1325931 RepID=A0AAJ1T4R6_9BACI|nr:spore germination protein [Oikeobacillus pervagus]MDQ0214790.1 spore germination protein PA [Oikeobacillus pervagus]